MANSRAKLVVAYSAGGLVGLIALLLGIYWLVQSIFPAGPAANPAVASPSAPTDSASPTATPPINVDWHSTYSKALRGGAVLGPRYSVGSGHVTCAAIGPQGELMLGTEDEGVLIYDTSSGWQTIGKAQGLADPAVYALATDLRGRVWIGHGSAGVSVWNGNDCQHYPIGLGPLGDRIFSIAVAPDGSVWLATAAGLSRYDDHHATWRHYTTAQGLPGLQAAKLAFAPNGKLYAAMQSAGLAVASPNDDYAHFQAIEALAPDKVTDKSGLGLPSNLCNDLVVTPQGHIYLATCYGLARSIDDGKTFYYFRGNGWAAQKNDQDDGKPPADKTTSPIVGGGDLEEDFIATLATDANGRIYLGYRDQGGQILEPATADPKAALHLTAALDCSEPTSMLITPGGYLLVTQTKNGARLLDPGKVHANPFKPSDPVAAPLPTAAGTPSREELATLLQTARAIEPDIQPGPMVMALEDDWATQGAYMGRHGKYLTALAAMVSPQDLVWGVGADRAHYGVTAPNGAMRYYVHANHTADPSALELPMPYLDTRVRMKLTTWQVDRREAEWNDYGGGPARAQDGPHVYVGMHIPRGLFVMSLYLHNKDGHSGPNSLRDYALSVRPAGKSLTDTANFADCPELAGSRVRQFWHGVYKQFLVSGPANLQVQVARNHSHMVTIAGAMLDEVDERSTAYFATYDQRQTARANDNFLRRDFALQKRPAQPSPATAAETADALLAEMDTAKAISPRWWGQNHRTIYETLLRFYQHQPGAAGQRQQTTCCYYLQLFEAWEKGLAAASAPAPRTVEKALRWSGNKDIYDTENYEMVRTYLAR